MKQPCDQKVAGSNAIACRVIPLLLCLWSQPLTPLLEGGWVNRTPSLAFAACMYACISISISLRRVQDGICRKKHSNVRHLLNLLNPLHKMSMRRRPSTKTMNDNVIMSPAGVCLLPPSALCTRAYADPRMFLRPSSSRYAESRKTPVTCTLFFCSIIVVMEAINVSRYHFTPS